MNKSLSRIMAACVSSAALLLGGCGGGGNSPGTPLLSNPPSVSLVSQAGSTILPNQTSVIELHATSNGHDLTYATVALSIGSGTSGGKVSPASVTTDSSGDAQVLYTAGPQQGQDTIVATATDATTTKTGSSSLTMQIGVSGVGPNIAMNLVPGSTSIAPMSSTPITVTATTGGKPLVNQTVQLTLASTGSGSPTLNGSTSPVTVTTDVNGQAVVTYVAGTQAGSDTIMASYSQNNAVLGLNSITLAVSSSAAPTWRVNLSGTQSNAVGCMNTSNTQGQALSCPTVAANTVGSAGMQTVGAGAQVSATVVDASGNPVPGAVVTFSLGSVSTATGLPYCTPPAVLTGNSCVDSTQSPAVTTAPSVGNVVPGFASGQNTVVATVTAVTDANGLATARYISGGMSGTDIVLVTAATNTGSVSTPIVGAQQGFESVVMNVQ